MTNAAAMHARCWNHEGREAVCRCPKCRRSYCRECVSEHESRLLCAACLARLARPARTASGARRRALSVALLAGGVLFAWIFFFGAAEGLLALAGRG